MLNRKQSVRRLTKEERQAKLFINHDYAANQARKAEEKGSLEIKDAKLPKTNVTALKALLTQMLLDAGMCPTAAQLAMLMEKFQFSPICDIKEHEVLTQWYTVEELSKYLIK